jgi:CheY-like chemotaxis protein/two-component sensor histidine kinase
MDSPAENTRDGSDGVADAANSEADRRKDEYIALLAHELRNLLAPIRYALAAMEKTDRTPAQQSYALGVMQRQSAHMSRLLEDLLDVSRFARGELELRRSLTELTTVLGTSIEAARPLLDGKQHSLSVQLPKDTVRVWADPVRLIQVFTNLLINAAKYTDFGGRIELRATQELDTVVVSVRDSGIGIAADMLPRIFTLFAQDKGARARSEGGLGIGLALVRGIVSLHGGAIEARSNGPGCGSEFVVRIPVGASPEEQAVAAETGNGAGPKRLKVLVVDDNHDVADTCSMLIELSGHQVQIAYTGKDAIAVAERFRPQVILTDIGLPDIDGYEFAQAIRATPWGKTAALVAVTGWGTEERQRHSVAAGFSHHLTKPIDPRTIESLLTSLATDFN